MVLRWYCIAGDDVLPRLVGSKAITVITARICISRVCRFLHSSVEREMDVGGCLCS